MQSRTGREWVPGPHALQSDSQGCWTSYLLSLSLLLHSHPHPSCWGQWPWWVIRAWRELFLRVEWEERLPVCQLESQRCLQRREMFLQFPDGQVLLGLCPPPALHLHPGSSWQQFLPGPSMARLTSSPSGPTSAFPWLAVEVNQPGSPCPTLLCRLQAPAGGM